jgi:L-asparagine transporter-like permease
MRRRVSLRGLGEAWFLLSALVCVVSIFVLDGRDRENAVIGLVISSVTLYASYSTRKARKAPKQQESDESHDRP